MKIGVASDHAGYEYKNRLAELLTKKGYDVADYGTYSDVSCDYSDYAHALGDAVERKEVDLGVALCGTGNGMAMSLNKHKGIRAACCSDTFSARMTRAHNNANVLCLGGRVVGAGLAIDMVELFLNTEFEGGRHQTRVDMITEVEETQNIKGY